MAYYDLISENDESTVVSEFELADRKNLKINFSVY